MSKNEKMTGNLRSSIRIDLTMKGLKPDKQIEFDAIEETIFGTTKVNYYWMSPAGEKVQIWGSELSDVKPLNN